jgi:putative flippase GtrA
LTESAGRSSPDQILRFLAVGGFNTLATGGIFLALSSVTAPALAYTVAFLVGIAFAVVVTPRLVFRTRASRSQGIGYMVWYLAIYAFGLGLVYLFHDQLHLDNMLVAAGTFVATAGLSFLGARFLFERTR